MDKNIASFILNINRLHCQLYLKTHEGIEYITITHYIALSILQKDTVIKYKHI